MTGDQAERACPFCAETIKAAAKVCKHCGRDLPPNAERPGIFGDPRSVYAPLARRRTTSSSTLVRLVLLLIVFPGLAFWFGTWGPGGGGIAVAMLLVLVPAIYFLPAYEAWAREHPKYTGVLLLNLFLGWTLLGWVVALVWGVSGRPEEHR